MPEVGRIVVPGHVEQALLALRRGEVLGFAGMIGADGLELFEGLLGLRPSHLDTLKVDGKPCRFTDARDAFAAGLVYLTEDRKGKGLLLNHSCRKPPPRRSTISPRPPDRSCA